MKVIPYYQRKRIITFLQEGYSSRSVAFHENVSHFSVIRIKQKKEKTGSLDVIPKSGYPRIFTERHDRNIAKLIKSRKVL
ncbi:3823_t:CDS:2 [Funneliformis geosporum]|nr:3823_t:CDS:2 [Funneliformis geosporum]